MANTTFRWVATVNDLVAESGMVNGEVAVVEGYGAAGDGGGGIFSFATTIPNPAKVIGATNATPIEITTNADHKLLTGQRVRIGGVGGNTGAIGTFTITVTANNKFTLDGSAGTAAYTSGGAVGNFGMTLPSNSATAGIWTRIRNSDANVLDVRCFGAQPGTTAGGDAIQFAIHEFIARTAASTGATELENYDFIYIPAGDWKLSKGLLIGRADGFYARCIIRGGDVVGPSSDDFSYFGGANLIFDDGSTAAKTTFVLAIQAATGVSITGVTFRGANHAPYDLATQYTDYRNLFLAELADYAGSGISTNRYSPHALVVVDPFSTQRTTMNGSQSVPGGGTLTVASTLLFPSSGKIWVMTDAGLQTVTYTNITSTTFTGCTGGTGTAANGAVVIGPPGGDPANCYSGWESYYQASTSLGSVGITLTSCGGVRGYVGTACSPSGFTGNGESICLDRCNFAYCAIVHAYGQDQSRGCTILDPRGWLWSYVAVDTFSIGKGTGTPPQIVNGVVGGGLKYLFNVGVNTQEFITTGLYCEATMSLGRLGYGSTAGTAKLIGCTFLLMSIADASASPPVDGLPDAPFHLSTSGTVELDGCNLGSHEDWCLRLDNRGVLVLRDVQLWMNFRNGQVPVGFNGVDDSFGTATATLDAPRVILLPSSQVVQEHPEWSRFSFAPVSGGALVKLHKTSNNTGVVQPMSGSLDTTGVQVGDLIGALSGGGGTQFQPTFISPALGGTFVPWGVVTAVDATSITLGLVAKGVPFDDATGTAMQRFRWNGTVTDSGVVSRGALYTADGSNPAPGHVVYVSGSSTVGKARANSTSTMPAVGVVVGYADNRSKVRVALFGQGEIQNLPSSISLSAGARYFVSRDSPGGLVTTDVSGFGSGDVVQAIGVAKATSTLGSSVPADAVVL